jgi:hypothetical protein
MKCQKCPFQFPLQLIQYFIKQVNSPLYNSRNHIILIVFQDPLNCIYENVNLCLDKI